MSYYKHGDRNAICDRCGANVKLSTLKRTWDGYKVCQEHWEPEHPQNKLRVRPERPRYVDGRPEGTDVYLDNNEVTATDL